MDSTALSAYSVQTNFLMKSSRLGVQRNCNIYEIEIVLLVYQCDAFVEYR